MGDDIDVPERLQEMLSDPHYNLVIGSSPLEAVQRGLKLLRAPLPCKVKSILGTRSCVNQPTSLPSTRTFDKITSPEDAIYLDNIKGFIFHFTSFIACAVQDSQNAQAHVDCLLAMLLRAAIPSADIMTSCLYALPLYRDTVVHQQPCYSVADFFVREAAPDDEPSGAESIRVVEDAYVNQSGSDYAHSNGHDDDTDASEHTPSHSSGTREESSTDEHEGYSTNEPEEYHNEPEEMLDPDDLSETTTSESLGPPPGSEDQILLPSTKQGQRPAVFCVTRLGSMSSLLASATYHRASVGAAGPLVLLAIDNLDSVAYVLFSNVGEQSSTGLPAIHVYTNLMARFDLTNTVDTFALGLFLRRWEDCRPRCSPRPVPHLKWRADIILHSSPRKKDIYHAFASADDTSDTDAMIQKWAQQVYIETNMSSPHSIVGSGSASRFQNFPTSNNGQSSKGAASSSKHSESAKSDAQSQTNLPASLYAKHGSSVAHSYIYWHGFLRVFGDPSRFSESEQEEFAYMPLSLFRSFCPQHLEIPDDMPKDECDTADVLATLVKVFHKSRIDQFVHSMPQRVNDIVIESMCGIVHAVTAALAVGTPTVDNVRVHNDAEFRAPWDVLVEAVTKSVLLGRLEYSREAMLRYFKRGILHTTEGAKMHWGLETGLSLFSFLNWWLRECIADTFIPRPLEDARFVFGENLEPVNGCPDAIIALPLTIGPTSRSGDLYKGKNIWSPGRSNNTKPKINDPKPLDTSGTGFNVRYEPTSQEKLDRLRKYIENNSKDTASQPFAEQMAQLDVSESSPPPAVFPDMHSHHDSASLSPAADAQPERPPVEESSEPTAQQKKVAAFILYLIVLVVEHKKADEEEQDAVAQSRMSLLASIRHLAAFNIGNLAVASLTTNGCLGRLSGGWLQYEQTPTLALSPDDPPNSIGVGFIADWDSVTYDIRQPEHAVQVAAFVAHQALHTQAVLQKLFKEVPTIDRLDDDVRQYLLDPKETRSPWALACEQDMDLQFMKPNMLAKAAADATKREEVAAMKQLRQDEEARAQQAASRAEGGSQKAGRHMKSKKPRHRSGTTEPSTPKVDENQSDSN